MSAPVKQLQDTCGFLQDRIAALEAENARLRKVAAQMLECLPAWHGICKSDESKRCPTCRLRAEAEAALTPASAARQEGRP